MSITQVVLSPPRPLAFTSIPRQLLRTRRMLLLQMASRNSWHLIQEAAADILDQASCERLSVLDDLIQQRAYVKLRQVERALDRMLDTSYGVCHRCRTDIPLPRLRAQPDAILCIACQEECEQDILLSGGAYSYGCIARIARRKRTPPTNGS
ncbi:MAG: TraR/DksA family transcriptional regulator [Nitrospira sp.]|nr:TraR/DksA family transcriptional regulator [Nitrospira sp.]